jgi:short-subunit dehydrogenase
MTTPSAYRLFVFGASSLIGEHTLRRFASRGARLFLVGRDPERLAVIRQDLLGRGAAEVVTAVCDALDFAGHAAVVEEAVRTLGALDGALIAHGTLPDQPACERSFETARAALDVNFLSVVSLATQLATCFEKQGHGQLAVITSVAGDRGRESNYVYGAAKAGVSAFLEGLRQRLHKRGVGVTDVRPGPVDTPMTKELRKGLLWSTPAAVARDIERAMLGKVHVQYTPWYWRVIMWVIRLIPRPLFVRLKL